MNFFKYLIPNNEDKQWGIYLNVCGSEHIPANISYPSKKHPSGYFYKWETGRVINEYQLVYISEGKGYFEDREKLHELWPGNMIILQPGKWHRYKPEKTTGWTEHYLGFSGIMAQHIFENNTILTQSPVLDCGTRENILDIYQRINDIIKYEKPACQQIAAGLVLQLMGLVVSIQKQKKFIDNPVTATIGKILFYLKQHYTHDINFESLAWEHSISYSHLRQVFKQYTGFSLLQYQLNLRVLKSKELLKTTNESIKSIALETGFQNIYYFSRLFKQKEGISPLEFRNLK